MIRILGIDGSPRNDGNSHQLLEHAMKHGKKTHDVEVDTIHLRNYDIQTCLACGVCGKSKKDNTFMPCILDDHCEVALGKMMVADGFIISTPVYFGLPPPLLLNFLNRTRVLRHQDFQLDMKVFGIMAIAGRRNGGQETTIINTWLPLIRNGCLPVGNGDKTCQFGVSGWAGAKGDVMKNEWDLQQSRDMFDRVFNVASAVNENKEHTGKMTFCYHSGGLPKKREPNFPDKVKEGYEEITGSGFTCSECGVNYNYLFDFCPDCGRSHKEDWSSKDE